MEIDIFIDSFTDCLQDGKTGKTVKTEYRKRASLIKSREQNGWNFDWRRTQKRGYEIYELFVTGDSTVQGRISVRIDGGVADVDIVESAPHNRGCNKKYIGVGPHLFAIACECSLKAGCDGVVAFTAKTDLVKHYQQELGAILLYGHRMAIMEDAAQKLLDQYIRK